MSPSRARRSERLVAGGLRVEYHESEAGHHIDPRELPAAADWLAAHAPAHGSPAVTPGRRSA